MMENLVRLMTAEPDELYLLVKSHSHHSQEDLFLTHKAVITYKSTWDKTVLLWGYSFL